MVIVVKMMIVMAYDKSRDDDINYGHDYDINSHDDHDDDDDHDNSDTGGMNDMIFRSTNIYYNQHHDISHLLELHDEVLMVSYDGDNDDDAYDHDNGDYNIRIKIIKILSSMISLIVLLHYQLRGQSSS